MNRKNEKSKTRTNQNNHSLVVISTYPERGETHSAKVVGIAACTKNTLLSLKEHLQKLSVTVLAEKFNGHKNQTYSENGITVKRIWRRNSLLAFPKLLIEIFKNHTNTNTVLLEFGLSIYGELFYLLPLPVFMLALKLMRKNLIVVFHEVIPDINEVYGHINIPKNSPQATLFNIILQSFYRFTFLCASKVIVFEEVLREKLKNFGKKSQISVIPIGVEEFSDSPTKRAARKMLGFSQNSFILLSFGFLAWYKGTDWIVQAIEDIAKKKKGAGKLELVIAGGANPNRTSKPYYTRYINLIEKKCQENGITLTGFVKESDIPLYFKAADLVVFPYRTVMGASAPLTLSFSFNKPFLFSDAMSGIFKTTDFRQVLEKLDIAPAILTFDANGEFARKIGRLAKDKSLQERMAKLSTVMAGKRSWSEIGKQYKKEIFN